MSDKNKKSIKFLKSKNSLQAHFPPDQKKRWEKG